VKIVIEMLQSAKEGCMKTLNLFICSVKTFEMYTS
jgi:hypothetical protein